MTIFKQGDYPNTYMGKSGVSIAKAGCLTCAITVGYNAINHQDMNPIQASKIFSYTSQGFLDWPSIKRIGLMLEEKLTKSKKVSESKLSEVLADPNKFCVLEINNGTHFVLLWGKNSLLGYKVYDPFYGDIAYRYKNLITGYRIISKS